MSGRKCMDAYQDGCEGELSQRFSGLGTPLLRCEAHWIERDAKQDETNRRYGHPDASPGMLPPDDFDPTYAGERWEDDW